MLLCFVQHWVALYLHRGIYIHRYVDVHADVGIAVEADVDSTCVGNTYRSSRSVILIL